MTNNSTEQTAPKAASPYSTGGGGVTLERRIVATYVARMLAGRSAPEIGGGRVITRVAVQQGPKHAVDDIVVTAELEDSTVTVTIASRRHPEFVTSDTDTRKLIRTLLEEIASPGSTGEQRLVIAVAGHQDNASQVQELADLARAHADHASFTQALAIEGRFRAPLTGRLGHVKQLVTDALADIGQQPPQLLLDGNFEADYLTWLVLTSLWVTFPRVESPDEADWGATADMLVPRSRGQDADGATALLDAIVTFVETLEPAGGVVDLTMLRRAMHARLHHDAFRTTEDWNNLAHLTAQVGRQTRSSIGVEPDVPLHLDRSDVTAALSASVAETTAGALVVLGPSGSGKTSALLKVLRSPDDEVEYVAMSIRDLPATSLEMRTALGGDLTAVLSLLTAPKRYLVIDGAEAALEGRRELVTYLVSAARAADVSVVVTTTPEGVDLINGVLSDQGIAASTFGVTLLTDDDIAEIAARFPRLAAIAGNASSRELLRRPVLADLLVRARFEGNILSEAGAMTAIWSGLIRKSDRLPGAEAEGRERVVRALAADALLGTGVDEAALDPAAIAGLRADGVLQPQAAQPWARKPAFAHDQLRTYAVAALLAGADDPAAELLAAGVPRWALPAMRIAAELRLESPAEPGAAFRKLQAELDAIAAQHGARWADVPAEALLATSDPRAVLRETWADLTAGDAAGFERLLRLLDQRHRDQYALRADALPPVLEALLDNGIPSGFGKRVTELTNDWLRTLVMQSAPAGHPLRIRLRQQVFDNIEEAKRSRAEAEAEATARRAARTPEQVAADDERAAHMRSLAPVIGPIGRSRPRRRLERELTNEWTIRRVALLGPDAGDEGADLLRLVAAEDGEELGPAVETVGAALAITQLDQKLLAVLTQAYYIEPDDEEDDWGYGGLRDDGIRDHDSREWGVTPMAAYYRGPFLWLFRTDLVGGVRVLNRMLNHAAEHRERRRARWAASGGDRTTLAITGDERKYIGDGHVWLWHAGLGVGPYSCMSALQALEHVVHEWLDYGVPLAKIVELLLDGCENLAIVALVVRLFAQRLDDAGALLDPFLSEPAIWSLEFNRASNEHYGFRIRADQPDETRLWNFRDVSVRLIVTADENRRAELQRVGDELVARAMTYYSSLGLAGAALDERVAVVRGWASYLDVSKYTAEQLEDGRMALVVMPPEEVVAALSAGNEENVRSQRALTLPYRYISDRHLTGRLRTDAPLEELLDDVAFARSIQAEAPELADVAVGDGAAAVAAAVVVAHLTTPGSVPAEDVGWATHTLLAATAGAHDDWQHFTQGADRSAALALPLTLISPPVEGGADVTTSIAALRQLATSGSTETRSYLAIGLSELFTQPCTDTGTCIHEIARDLLVDSARGAVVGPWNENAQQRDEVVLDDPIIDGLTAVDAQDIISQRLSPAIRGLAAAAVSASCVADEARILVIGLLEQQARGATSHDLPMHDSELDALTSARAALTLAEHGVRSAVLDLLKMYAPEDRALGMFLHGLAAAAEEADGRAAALRTLWPDVITTVLGLVDAGALELEDGYFDGVSLSALIPYPATPPNAFRQRELDGHARQWWDIDAWRPAIEQWLPYAAGRASCLDHLLWITDSMSDEDKATTVLPWVETILSSKPEDLVAHSRSLTGWVRVLRPAVLGTAHEATWQRVTDLVVLHGGVGAADLAD